MKKIIGILACLSLLVAPGAWAAEVAISALPAATALTSDDLTIIVDAPGGSAATKKITIGNFFCAGTAIEQGDVFYYDGTNIKCLPHGTAGNPLITGGNAANPSWLDLVVASGANTFSLTKGTASLDVAAGATLNIDTSLAVQTGAVTLTGNAAASTLVLPASSFSLFGATTEILVGGGAGVVPLWTTATGTGAPVRAGSPAITGSPTISGNNANASYTLLNLINNDTTTGSETSRTADLVFSIYGSIAETTNVALEAAKISAYQVSDFYSSGTADIDAGLKFYTTNNNSPTLALTISNLGLATFAGAVTVSGTLTTTGAALTTPDIGAATGTSLMATGRVDGTVGVLESTAGSATAVSVATHGHASYFINLGNSAANSIFTLPAAEAGLQYCFKNGTGITQVLTIQTSGAGEYIDLDGTNTASGGFIHTGGAAGDGACVVGIKANYWMGYPSKGTWTRD